MFDVTVEKKETINTVISCWVGNAMGTGQWVSSQRAGERRSQGLRSCSSHAP